MRNKSIPKRSEEEHNFLSSVGPVFVTISVIALLGNCLIVFLFMRKRSWLKKAHNNLILTLAAADILTAVCILVDPSFIYGDELYSVPNSAIARELYCRLLWSHYVVFSLGITSVYTSLFLAIERWLAIGKPLWYKRYIHTRKNITVMVVLPWIAGFAFESPAAIYTTGVMHDAQPGCMWNQTSLAWSARAAIAVLSFFAMILVPGGLVIAIYIQILLRADTIRRSSFQRGFIRKSKRDFKRITLMAALASVTLIICWLPNRVYFMLGQMGYVWIHGKPHRWLNVLALSNICLNPLIYAFSNSEYRQGIKMELGLFVSCRRKSHNSSTNSREADLAL